MIRDTARALLPRIDTVIFDVDGVLLDVSRSIRQVNIRSLPAYLRLLPGWSAPDDLFPSEEVERFKRAGGFNDDWDLACAIVLLYLFKAARYGMQDAARLRDLTPTVAEYTDAIAAKGGWLSAAEAIIFSGATEAEEEAIRAHYDKPRIQRIFQEMWAGDRTKRLYGYEPAYYPGKGAVQNDRPLIDLSRLPTDRTLAILTGRTRPEAQLALEFAGLDTLIPLPERGITEDDGFHKPDPGGMRALLLRLGSRVAVYIGDALDDLRTVKAFRTLPEADNITLLSAQVLTGTVRREDAPALFADADILAPDVNAVLDLLNEAQTENA